MPNRVEFSIMIQANIRRENSITPTKRNKSKGSTRANSTIPCALLRRDEPLFLLRIRKLFIALPLVGIFFHEASYCESLVKIFSAIAAKISVSPAASGE